MFLTISFMTESHLNLNILHIYILKCIIKKMQIYYRKKAQLRKIKHAVNVEEKMLFHGTGHSNIQAICTYNFDWRLTGSHGDVYGKGTVHESFCIKGMIHKR